jgi:hypothetical protein
LNDRLAELTSRVFAKRHVGFSGRSLHDAQALG